jgi:protein-S-isoprenylcysteine O-methyltransferase Ste14
MKAMQKSAFNGFYIGAVASALLLSYGIESAVATASDPLTAGISAIVNWIIHRFQLEALYLPTDTVPRVIACYTGIGAVIAVLLGLRLGMWVKRKSSIQS